MGIYLKDSAGNEVLAVSVNFVLTYHPLSIFNDTVTNNRPEL
jgi:hypothetical protein